MNEIEQMREAKSELTRANNADQILNNPAFIEAIQMMRVDCLGAFQHSGQSDDKKHSEIWLQLNAIKELEDNLNSIVRDGSYARDELTRLQKIKKAMKL